jgi:PAS domain-containing protein
MFKRWTGKANATIAPGDGQRHELIALREQVQFLQAAVENAPVAIAIYDATDQLKVHNSHYQSFYTRIWDKLGQPVTYPELVRASLTDSGFKGDLEAEVARRVAMQHDNNGQSEERQYADGTWRKVTKRKLPDGTVAGFAIDISELRRREEHLSRSLGQLRQIADNTVPQAMAGFANAAQSMGESTFEVKELIRETVERAVATGVSAEELATTIDSVATSMGDAAQRVTANNTEAEALTGQMAKLSEAFEKVESFAGLIQGIASQTNLLALNATIEAARAGESGRGFAVVAAEVKALSHQTAEAASQITAQIDAVESLMAEAKAIAGRIGVELQEISQRVGDVAAAAQQQRGAAGLVSSYMADIVKRGSDVSRAVERSMADGDSLKETARRLESDVAAALARVA